MSKILIALYMASLPGLRCCAQGPNYRMGNQQQGNPDTAQEDRYREDSSTYDRRTDSKKLDLTTKRRFSIKQFVERARKHPS
jgi:hypothetical protein